MELQIPGFSLVQLGLLQALGDVDHQVSVSFCFSAFLGRLLYKEINP